MNSPAPAYSSPNSSPPPTQMTAIPQPYPTKAVTFDADMNQSYAPQDSQRRTVGF